jgi:peptide/nickel transport system ATP-binding protein
MKPSNDAFLSVRDLVVEYTSEDRVIHAVNGVSFDLKRGKTFGLVGETGSGKTTIPKAILRILPDPPAKIRGGEIYFDGVDLLKLGDKEMRKIRGRKISMIFGSSQNSGVGG